MKEKSGYSIMGVPMTPLITDYLGSSGMYSGGKGGKKMKGKYNYQKNIL